MIRTPRYRFCSFVAWLLAGSILASCWAREAAAAPQVSDRFKHVSRELAKRIASTQLTKVCKKSDGVVDEVCAALVDSLRTVFEMAIDGEWDDRAVAAALKDELAKVAEAAAVETARKEIERLFATIPEPPNTCSAVRLVRPLAACVIAASYRGAKGAEQACAPARAAATKAARSCGKGADLSKLDAAELVLRVREVLLPELSEGSNSYAGLLLLTKLARVLEKPSPTFYGMARAFVDEQEDLLQGLSMQGRMHVYSASAIKALMDAAKARTCKNARAVRARAARWYSQKDKAFLGIGRAVARWQRPPDSVLSLLPDDLPDPMCPSPDDPLARAVTELKSDAHTLRVDATVAGSVQAAVPPSLLVAMLVDAVRGGSRALTLESAKDFGLQALASAIAGYDEENPDLVCTEVTLPPDKRALTCRRRGTADLREIKLTAFEHPVMDPDRLLDDLRVFVQERHYPGSARRSCV